MDSKKEKPSAVQKTARQLADEFGHEKLVALTKGRGTDICRSLAIHTKILGLWKRGLENKIDALPEEKARLQDVLRFMEEYLAVENHCKKTGGKMEEFPDKAWQQRRLIFLKADLPQPEQEFLEEKKENSALQKKTEPREAESWLQADELTKRFLRGDIAIRRRDLVQQTVDLAPVIQSAPKESNASLSYTYALRHAINAVKDMKDDTLKAQVIETTVALLPRLANNEPNAAVLLANTLGTLLPNTQEGFVTHEIAVSPLNREHQTRTFVFNDVAGTQALIAYAGGFTSIKVDAAANRQTQDFLTHARLEMQKAPSLRRVVIGKEVPLKWS